MDEFPEMVRKGRNLHRRMIFLHLSQHIISLSPPELLELALSKQGKMSTVTTCLHREELQEKHLAPDTHLAMHVCVTKRVFYINPDTKV